MYVVKRKYIIKFFALIIILFTLITGIFLQNKLTEEKVLTRELNLSKAFFFNLLASSQKLEVQFEILDLQNPNSGISKDIYAQVLLMKNHIYSSGYSFSYALNWLSDMEEYAKTDMTDTQKNSLILQQLKDINKSLLSQHGVFKFPESLDIANNAFSFTSSFSKEAPIQEDQYSILQNQITAERKDISEFAKDILNSPLTPARFKGGHLSKDALSFFGVNSYATVFPSGKILEKMATTAAKHRISSFDSALEAADFYFKTYAHFAPQCKLAFSIEQSDSLYAVFCPVITISEGNIFNYDEPIKLGVSQNDFSLIAFDASGYLKKHTAKQTELTIPHFPAVQGDKKRYVIIKGEVFMERIIEKNGQNYFSLTSNDGNLEFFTQNEYMNYAFFG